MFFFFKFQKVEDDIFEDSPVHHPSPALGDGKQSLFSVGGWITSIVRVENIDDD